jgi:hypothetical protein
MRFQRNISLLLGKMETRRCVFTGGSDPASLIGDGLAAMATRHGKEASAARRQEGHGDATWRGAVAERRDSEAAACCASEGQRPCAQGW